MKKTLVVGLDAACWEYLEPLLQAGRLPTLQRLMDAGARGVLHSTLPAHTPTAWASIVTGKNPGKHGVYDHLWRRPGSYEFVPPNARVRQGTPFWKHLNDHGIRVGLVNVPFTHPPDPIEGFVVGGFGTPNAVPDITYPPGILEWIETHIGPYEPSVDPKLLRTAPPAELLEAEKAHQAQQVQIAAALADQQQVQVLAINLMFFDHANHRLLDMDLVEQSLCQSDTDIESLIHAFRPDNIMLFSDHGSRRVQGTFLLDAWLRDHGYCTQAERSPSESAAVLNWVLLQWMYARWGRTGLLSKIIRRVVREMMLRLPDSVAGRFWNKIEETIPFAREYVRFSKQMDFERTRLFLGASYSGLLYFNLAEREPTGVVSAAERSALAAELIEKLSHIPDPQLDQPLITHVYRAGDIYEGATVEHGPDLILDTYDASCNVLTNYRRGAAPEVRKGNYFIDDCKELGRHTRDGMFVFSGQDFGVGQAQNQGHVMDLPATLLHLYDVPIPEDYDGRSLTELMTPEFVNQHPIAYQSGDDAASISFESIYSAAETEGLMAHLKALGYVD